MIGFMMVIPDEQVRSKLEEIYVMYHRDMFVTAYSILKDHHEAEDVVQNVVLKLTKNLHKIPDIECKRTRAYLVIIVRNLSYDAYNRKKGQISVPFEEMSRIKDDVVVDDFVIKIEESKAMATILNRMYQPYGDILTLRYYHDLSITEIAETLDITENNVSVRINRALKALKNTLNKGGDIFGKTV